MNVDSIKIELIDWIAQLKDQRSINRIVSLKQKLSDVKKSESKIFGSGKHLIEFIDDDFNESLEQFFFIKTPSID